MSASSPQHLEITAPDRARHRYVVLDVFTAEPLEGNQLAVFLDGSLFPEARLQAVARELNLAETVFVLPPEGSGDVRLRIFTPQRELPFAGHPVLGTAVAVGVALDRDRVRLETRQETVAVALERRNGKGGFARITQVAPIPQTYEAPEELLAALGVAASLLPIEVYRNGPRHVFVAADGPAAVSAVQPDHDALAELGICANVVARDGTRWKTRMFAPALGVREDAATGSAAGPLALHLARHGWIGFGEEIEIHQGAELGRPSVLYARADGTAEEPTALSLAGAVVIVAQGSFYLD